MGKKIEECDNKLHQAVPTKTLAEQAYDLLEEKLITLQLEPGSFVSESALVKELNIGRTPVREALQKLARVGLVNILPHKGVMVSEINPLKQLQLMEVRKVLEQLMVRTTTMRCSVKDKEFFNELADSLEMSAEENDDIKFMRYDNIFHVMIAKFTNNEYMYRALDLYNSLSRRFWYMHNINSHDMPHCARLHANVAREISGGDPDKAVEEYGKLFDYLVEVTRSKMIY